MKSKLIKAVTLGIAIGPEALHAVGTFQATGDIKQVGVDVVSAYSGYNLNDGHFYANDLARGYVPIVAAMAFRKAMTFLR